MLKVTDKPKNIVILGAGGTGSWLANFLSKLDLKNVVLVDGDIVELKNVSRQAFTTEDINKNKAEVLSKKLGFQEYTEYITDTDVLKEHFLANEGVPFVIGCLDNNGTRKIVHDLFTSEVFKDFIWVDSGNAERHGQTYIAVKEDGLVKYPSPLDIDEAFSVLDGSERRPDQISCAEQSISVPQNVAANVMAATTVFNVVNNIVHGGSLLGNKVSWDTRFLVSTVTESLESLKQRV